MITLISKRRAWIAFDMAYGRQTGIAIAGEIPAAALQDKENARQCLQFSRSA